MNYKTIKKYLVAVTLTVSFILSLGFGGNASVKAEPGYYGGQVRVYVQRRPRHRVIRHYRVARYYRRHHHG